jgi:hypothetical protein
MEQRGRLIVVVALRLDEERKEPEAEEVHTEERREEEARSSAPEVYLAQAYLMLRHHRS